MQLARFGGVTVLLLTILSPSTAMCSDWAMPEPGEKVELLLKFGEVVDGTLIELDSNHIVIMREDKVAAEVRIPTAAVAGIRHPGDSVFRTLSGEPLPSDFQPSMPSVPAPPRTIKVRVYDKLPFMGVAIMGGVFAGDRFGRASSERDLADSLRKLGLDDEARALEDRAHDHEAQAWIGVLIGAAGVLIASIPSYEETPVSVVMAQAGDLATVSVGFDLARLFSGRGRSSPHAAGGHAISSQVMVSAN